MATAPAQLRTRFRVVQVIDPEGGQKTLMLSVVQGGVNAENKAFFKWPPSAQINLSALTTDVDAVFAPGREFFVDFTPADAGAD